ncbi:MAG: hypothetical protein ACFFBD_22325 [Candidatus Hodarchaeota archaeon]
MVGHPNTTIVNLILSIIIDIIGMLTYLFPIPFVGEVFDVIWAPISGFLIYRIYGRRRMFGIIGTVEELLPLTDLIPTATLIWLYLFFFKRDEAPPESPS